MSNSYKEYASKQHVSTDVAAAVKESKDYTDEKIAALGGGVSESNQYTDTKIAEEVTNRNSAISTAKSEANSYADTKASETLESAKDYADSIVTTVTKSNTNGNVLINGSEVQVYSHPGTGTNPHSTTKADVGLGNVDNTADVNKSVASAAKLTTARTISLSGDVSGSAEFDGSKNTAINTTIDKIDANKLTGKVPAECLPTEFMMVDAITGNPYVLRVELGKLVLFSPATYIYIKTLPNRLEYYTGEELDYTGMVVIAVDADGKERDVTEMCEFDITSGTDIAVTYYEGGYKLEMVEKDVITIIGDDMLIDFEYTTNSDGTYTLTDWKGTYNGEPSTKIVVPNSSKVIL